MDLEDYLEPEIAVTAAVTAAVFSPRGRQFLRRGAVYGIAGAMIVGDAITSFTRNISQGFKQTGTSTSGETSSPKGTSQEQGSPA
jgi:hypothetical protein